MPDYIYLLENRLSPSQQSALQTIREAARESGMTVFLTGGAVRDLTSGSPVRDLDVSVQGNALELKHKLEHAGAILWGEHEPSQTLFARFPGSVRGRGEQYPGERNFRSQAGRFITPAAFWKTCAGETSPPMRWLCRSTKAPMGC
jgi:tRNA nucleotidyltransferase (CCA-adding enzyme)